MRIQPANGDELQGKAGMEEDGRYIPSIRLILTAAIAVLSGGFHFGFQMAILNPMAEVLQHFLMTAFERRYHMPVSESFLRWAWSALAGSLFIGAALGAWAGAWMTQRKGATKTVIAAAMLLGCSISLSGFAYLMTSCELFVVSRLFTGFGIGMGTTAHGVLLTEISHVNHRGFISSFGGFSTNIGFILASFLGLPDILGQPHRWHIAYFIAVAPCVIVVAYFICCPFDNQNDSEVNDSSPQSTNVSIGVKELLRDVAARKALLLSAVLNGTVSFSGIIAMSFFGTFMLSQIGFSSRSAAIANCLASLAGTAGAITATLAVDRVGRRLLVVSSLLLLAMINALMMALVLLYESTMWMPFGHAFFLLFIAFLFIFSAGAGPAAWFIGAELASPVTRPKIQAASIGTQYLTCFLSPIIYFPLQKAVGAYSFTLFIVPLTLSAAFFYRSLPETRGRSTEDIALALKNE